MIGTEQFPQALKALQRLIIHSKALAYSVPLPEMSATFHA